MGPGPYSQKAECWLTARPPTQNSWPVGPSGPPGPPRPGLEEPHQVDGTRCAPQHGCPKHRMEALGDTGGTLVSLCAGEETEARGVAGNECRAGLSLPLLSHPGEVGGCTHFPHLRRREDTGGGRGSPRPGGSRDEPAWGGALAPRGAQGTCSPAELAGHLG